jgi:hypothetical protein
MRDLFDLFPDLPWMKARPTQQRILEARRRADEVRKKFQATQGDRLAAVARAQATWKKKLRER